MQLPGRPAFQQHGQTALSPSFHLWRRGPQPPGPRPPRPAPRRPSSTAAVALHHHVLLLTAVEAAQHSAPSPPSTATTAAVPGSHGRVPLDWRRRRGVPAVIGATLTRGMRLLLLLEFFKKYLFFTFCQIQVRSPTRESLAEHDMRHQQQHHQVGHVVGGGGGAGGVSFTCDLRSLPPRVRRRTSR